MVWGILLDYVSLAALIVYGAVMIRLHREFREYDPIRQPVSDYGVGPSRRLFAIAGSATMISALCMAGALEVWSQTFPFKTAGVVLLVVRAATVAGVLIVPTDLTGRRRTVTGWWHYLFAIVQFIAVAVFVFNFAVRGSFWDAAPWFPVVIGSLVWLVKLSLVGLVLGMAVPKLKHWFGLFERGFLFSSAVYFLVLGLTLAKAM